jgi:hypothetical protein
MSIFFGPLDLAGRVPTRQQTRVAAFLMSCHGAIARQLAIVLASQMNTIWHIELNTQFYREAETVSLLLRATSWVPDPELLFLLPTWEAAWVARSPPAIADRIQGLVIDIASLAHAVHSMIRPAALLPQGVLPQDPFALALRKIEFESSRAIQAQIVFLKSTDLLPLREEVTAAVESRHGQLDKLWQEVLSGIGIDRSKST